MDGAGSGSLAGCLRGVGRLRRAKSLRQLAGGARNTSWWWCCWVEDVAALVGLVLAMAFVGLAMVTGGP